MKKILSCLSLLAFLLTACDTNKPAEEVKDAQDRVKQKIEDGRQGQEQAAEETGEQSQEEETP